MSIAVGTTFIPATYALYSTALAYRSSTLCYTRVPLSKRICPLHTCSRTSNIFLCEGPTISRSGRTLYPTAILGGGTETSRREIPHKPLYTTLGDLSSFAHYCPEDNQGTTQGLRTNVQNALLSSCARCVREMRDNGNVSGHSNAIHILYTEIKYDVKKKMKNCRISAAANKGPYLTTNHQAICAVIERKSAQLYTTNIQRHCDKNKQTKRVKQHRVAAVYLPSENSLQFWHY